MKRTREGWLWGPCYPCWSFLCSPILESKIMMTCGCVDLFQSISHDPLASGKKGKQFTPGGKVSGGSLWTPVLVNCETWLKTIISDPKDLEKPLLRRVQLKLLSNWRLWHVMKRTYKILIAQAPKSCNSLLNCLRSFPSFESEMFVCMHFPHMAPPH